MADTTKIEWTDATWNPITGCTVHSAGCTNCYAMQLAGTRLRNHPSRKGLTREVNGNHVWTGEVRFNEQWLLQPLQWKRPRDIFVCAHADLFHGFVPDAWIDKIFAVMAMASHHRFQVLTKRSDRMRAYMTRPDLRADLLDAASHLTDDWKWQARGVWNAETWPLPNVWLGVSVEDQKAADERIPDLLATPAAIRWLSCEPLLGPVDLNSVKRWSECNIPEYGGEGYEFISCLRGGLDWIVCGGESGPNARPMHPDWARSLRDQCAAAGVPFHFKQWGEWVPGGHPAAAALPATSLGDQMKLMAKSGQFPDGQSMFLVGKKAAGRLLDGVQHDGVPT
ncbi:MAG: phage Gp37/Gp68 family protein [Pseudomonadota bacterium]|nr:phage Gp37/Gp68 family protein [Pseudomonadota bacterium]